MLQLMSSSKRIWALELANELSSSARIDGFDISPAQFTPQAWCGNKVHLRTHDAFKPFPPEYLGQYDIVHLRLFGLVANNENAEPLLKNLITLLSVNPADGTIPIKYDTSHAYTR